MKKIINVAVATALSSSSMSYAAVSDQEWQQFKAQFAEMAARVEALEAENARLRTSPNTVPVEDLSELQADVQTLQAQREDSSWTENIAMKGDFRYRYEAIDLEDTVERERHRIRARVGIVASLPSNTEVGFAMATGGDNPLSSNQTLGNGFSRKDLDLDKAYFKWQATDELYLQAGKFSNPLYTPQRSALLWDTDWRPEGVSAGWQKEHLFFNVVGNFMESDTRDDNDRFAWGIQGGTRFMFGDASLTTAIGYYDFPTKGAEAFYDDNFYGNTSVDDRYAYDYEIVELGADLGLSLFSLPFNVFAHMAQNQAVDEYDLGWQAGARLGKAKGKGTWQLGYRYQHLEADAVLGLISDADFAAGGTDGKGHRLRGTLGINKQWNIGLTWFLHNKAGQKALAEQGGELEYDRIMIDTAYKY